MAFAVLFIEGGNSKCTVFGSRIQRQSLSVHVNDVINFGGLRGRGREALNKYVSLIRREVFISLNL